MGRSILGKSSSGKLVEKRKRSRWKKRRRRRE